MSRSRVGNFMKSFSDGYNLTNGLLLDYGLSRAGDVKPETIETPEQPTKPQMSVAPVTTAEEADARAESSPMSPQMNMDPNASPGLTFQASTRYKLGDKEQDTQFSQQQIDAQRFRNQADVYSRFGMAEKASSMQGLAKVKDTEAVDESVKAGAKAGLERDFSDLSGKEKAWKQTALLADGHLANGNTEKYLDLTKNAKSLQQELINEKLDRADLITDPAARLTEMMGAYKYILDGKDGHEVIKNQDGTYKVAGKDGSTLIDGISTDPKSPKSIDAISLQLRSPDTIHKLQYQAMADKQKSDIEDNSLKTKAIIGESNAKGRMYDSNARYNDGARSDAAAAKANGQGDGVRQQALDEKAFQQYIKENGDHYTITGLDGVPKTNIDVKSAYTRLVRRLGPEGADNQITKIRSKAEADATDEDGNLDQDIFNKKYIAGMRVAGAPQVSGVKGGPAKEPPPAPKIPKQDETPKSLVSNNGIARASPPPVKKELQSGVLENGKMVRRGEPYWKTTSVPDGKGGWMKATMMVENVIDTGTGEITTRKLEQNGLPSTTTQLPFRQGR